MTYEERREDFESKLSKFIKKYGLSLDNVLNPIRTATDKDELPAEIRKTKDSKPNALYLYMLFRLNEVAFDTPENQIGYISGELDFIKDTLTKDTAVKHLFKELWSLEL